MELKNINGPEFKEMLIDSIIDKQEHVLKQLSDAKKAKMSSFRMIEGFGDLLKVSCIEEPETVLIINDKSFFKFIKSFRSKLKVH